MSNRMAVAGRGHAVMSRYSALLLAVLCATAAPGVVSTAAAQARASDAERWEVPRTPDGHPDLQGNWTNATLTSFEREEVNLFLRGGHRMIVASFASGRATNMKVLASRSC